MPNRLDPDSRAAVATDADRRTEELRAAIRQAVIHTRDISRRIELVQQQVEHALRQLES